MENRHDNVLEKVVEQALVIALKVAIESVPVVGPIFFALSIVSDVRRVNKALR
jgi:hypothetical protein